jgi:TPR repeat protein
MRLLRPLAEQGVPAQTTVALMYYHGRGAGRTMPKRRWFRPPATGRRRAQFNLGVMYGEGQGCRRTTRRRRRYRPLPTRIVQAQQSGLWYAQGEDGAQDYVSAHMWFNLAAARFPATDTRNRGLAVRNRDLVAGKMTRDQLAEAQKLAREWKPK